MNTSTTADTVDTEEHTRDGSRSHLLSPVSSVVES
jgi:hypothetical protein